MYIISEQAIDALAVSGGDWRLSAILALGMCGYTVVHEDGRILV